MLGLSVAMTIACIGAVYIGATVQASVGIGLGMISSPVLAIADPGFVPVAIMLAVVPMSLSIAWADREHVVRRDVGFALLGRLPGVVLGALVVAALSDRVLAVLVAASVLFAVVVSFTGKRFHPSDTSLVVAGLASGFTGTTTGVGGPPMALAYQHSDPARMRSTLSVFFGVGAVMSLAALAIAGQIGVRQFALTALILPSVGVGVITARRIKHRLDASIVRPAVLVLCTVTSIALLVETF